MSRFVKLAGVLGLSIAFLLSIVWRIHNGGKLLQFGPPMARMLEKITVLFWPPSLLLMATDNSSWFVALFATLLSLLLNALLYMLVAYLGSKVYRALI
jgi:hypothetical protein